MRSDYMLYAVAAICFIITGLAFALAMSAFERNLSVVSSVILGFFFVGLGFTQRPKPRSSTILAPNQSVQPISTATAIVEVQATTPPPPEEIATQPPKTEEAVVLVETVAPAVPAIQLTDVKGIGPKRLDQLKGLGISTVDDLSRASVNDLAKQLNVSPKVTAKWVDGAKELAQKS